MQGRSSVEAIVGSIMHEREVIFRTALLNPKSDEFKGTTFSNAAQLPQQAQGAWEQAYRSRWRALYLSITAKLEAIVVELTTFEEEFLAHIQMSDGRSVVKHVTPYVTPSCERWPDTPVTTTPRQCVRR